MAFLRRLAEFDSAGIVELQTLTDTILDIETLIEGNSILSTVFLSSVSVGGSLLVEYYDDTLGGHEGETYALNAHKLLTAPLQVDRLTVTRIHNKPKARITIIGTCRFSVYLTVVSSFASDLDAALQFEGDLVDVNRDNGMPITAYETTTNEWSFLRTLNGRLQVDVPNVIQTTQQLINKRLYKLTYPALPNTENEDIIYTVPTNKKLYLSGGKGWSDSWASWELLIDDVVYDYAHNNQVSPQVTLGLPAPMALVAGQVLKIKTKNVGNYLTNSIIKTFFYGAEEDV